ncbi:threonine-phosphate decarboxylase [Halomicronema hongdechloris C2206]|uniref:Threonine-phosphate decarboxylase n=1 Tax=Halomicronema hongdechloris C2206 TaxID=1641165 RepID=A0A1Z3HQN4_9CYAN|nr:threonine-phosphate decarboxylase [Halomicronema hongdechloris C2206]
MLAAIQAQLSSLATYPDPAYSQLRQGLARHHGISPNWILPGNGAAELLTWACRELATQTACLLPTPAFGDYRRGLQGFAATIVSCPLLTNQGTEISLEQAIASAPQRQGISPDSGLLLNNPHNPTGRLFHRDQILPLLDTCALVVVDEAFMDFLPPGQQQSVIDLVGPYDNLVVVRSQTKFYSLPGLRLGYAIAQPERLQRWQHWRDPWPVNILAATAALAAIQDQPFQQQSWAWLGQARPQLVDGLTQLPGLMPWPGAANYLLVRSDVPVPPLQEALLRRHRILIRDCLSFPELGEHYFRVAIRTPDDNQRLLTALADVLIG